MVWFFRLLGDLCSRETAVSRVTSQDSDLLGDCKALALAQTNLCVCE